MIIHPTSVYSEHFSLRDMFRTACRLDVLALKPGNVNVESPGHGMTANDFLLSADVSASCISDGSLGLGERIFYAANATHNNVGCNTNLGILLLVAPLFSAFQTRYQGEELISSLQRTLSCLSKDDAIWTYRAIRIARPGGLGSSDRHDVFSEPTVSLLEAMKEAELRDRIAFQYTHNFKDILEDGRNVFINSRKHWGDDSKAMSMTYLHYLTSLPDSHILRKHGSYTAINTQSLAAEYASKIRDCKSWPCIHDFLSELDRIFKSSGINPGTSADLTVATWIADSLLNIEEKIRANKNLRNNSLFLLKRLFGRKTSGQPMNDSALAVNLNLSSLFA